MPLGVVSDLRIELHFAGHRQRGPHAVLGESSELAGGALITVQARGLVEYDRVSQELFNGHRSVKTQMVDDLTAKDLGRGVIRYGLERQNFGRS